MNNGRDCLHGRQVGKCDTCELIEAEKLINELEHKNAELAAQVEQLRDAMQDLMAFQVKHLDVWHNPPYDRCSALMKTTPAQCLAEIKAQAGRDAVVSALRLYGEPSMTVSEIDQLADRYANQLLQQVKP